MGDEAALPDPEVVESLVRGMVDLAPDGWSELLLVVWERARDVLGYRMWVQGPDVSRRRLQAPTGVPDLVAMRDRQVAAGAEPWRRCELRVSRAPGSAELDLDVRFGYEAGEVPE